MLLASSGVRNTKEANFLGGELVLPSKKGQVLKTRDTAKKLSFSSP